jgi:hypothetical protein
MVTNASKVILIAIFLLFVQGCRINQEVPIGGHIVSSPGAYDCAEDQTCIVDTDIGSIFPKQTFTAVPAPGYRFVGWKDENGYLCRGLTTACETADYPVQFTVLDIDIYLAPIFEIELLDLLPATTRGVFQVYPGAPGAIDTSVTSTTWGSGPLQILQKYSAEMDIAGNARRLVLAQLANASDQSILLATLDTSDVDTLSAGMITAAGIHQGYQLWSIDGTDLELAKIDSLTLAIGPHAALQQALDAYTGAAPAIGLGPLTGVHLSGLKTGTPNSFIYGLPALYGAVTAPGTGAASLSQARVVSSSFSVENDTLTGTLAFFTNNASTFSAKLKEQLTGYPTPAITAYGTVLAAVNLNGLSVANDIRPLLKTLIQDMDGVDYAGAVSHAGNPPFLNFKVGENPNSIFINFEFTDATARADFAAAHLPTGFSLAPISILENELPRYYLVLNMYQSSGGLVNGARAEWSVFVNDPYTGEPRFLVVEAQADSITADSVNLLVLTPHVLTHKLTPTAIESCVGVPDCAALGAIPEFSSTITWPQIPETRMLFDREFVVSNDYIFWGNGVADRGLYNSSVFNREGVLVDTTATATQFSFTDNTGWASYVKPEPVNALVYLNPLEIVISPWWNLDESYLDIILEDPAANPTRTALINFKNGFYPNLVKGNAQSAIRGEGLALSSTTVADAVPTASYHFPLFDASVLLNDVAGPGVYTPLAIELFDGETAGHYLTLSVYQREGDPCGTRAEWVTYVEGTGGRPETLRLDTFAAEPCLDPVSLITVAADISQTHNLVSNTLQTQITSPFTRFEGSVNLNLTNGAQAGLNWLESGDRSCSLNNICDEFYIDGQLLMEDANVGDISAINIDTMATPWDSYIDTGAVRAGVRLTPAIQAMNPWRNMRSFAAPAPAP